MTELERRIFDALVAYARDAPHDCESRIYFERFARKVAQAVSKFA